MELKIKSKQAQHAVELFGGRLKENKPLAGDPLYSNLIYWAHVEAPEEGTFPMHPHEGIEILTFIFEGGLEHYDTASDIWTPLLAGGVQQIQAGNGVYHSEKYIKGSRAFQIWFDPDFNKSLNKSASYKDFQAEEFSWARENNLEVMNYVGENAPIQTDAEGISVKRYKLTEGIHQIVLDENSVYSVYLMKGSVKIEGQVMLKDAFTKIEDKAEFEIKSSEESELFVLASPKNVSYKRISDR
ncbi:pirin family protein [Sediminitomix flava]|uniref:Redox-sensitive bicupin YhaK (Pirin superfamily) n=1 Tax=Sediminitomix flava TaxID=379075 RepID=A0A315ZHC9_SEDFL|nr:pirin family protein [Sediminitomix flava]PWJ45015.1 redox-sensitive bicupin YhaK (pirin superfamily) [Sediminitomix flava]